MKKRSTSKSVPLKRRRSKPFPIVAIGASAGGLEAVTELLKNLSPDTGMAYVYIQHLDPTHKSMLSTILAKTTTMVVLEAKNLLPIKANHLYIIPPNKEMNIIDGVLKLNPRPQRPILSLPINRFFNSLAEKQKEGAIGIVLSGNASDGAQGLKAIKMAGGVTFAQDHSAKFQSMPKSAIAEGGVDLVLPPAEIAKELERLSKQMGVLKLVATLEEKEEEIDEPSDEDLAIILQLLKRTTGVDFTHYKKNTIKRRILRRMILHRLNILKEYAKQLKRNTNEVNILYQDLLINVTSFFRDPEAMIYLKKKLLPKIVKTKTAKEPIRVWVPACSTGQEAYSIAILLMEVLGDKASNTTIQIFATDLSETAIAKARLGLYTKDDVSEISPNRLRKFFAKVDGQYRIAKSIRDLCVFAPHNVLKDPPFSRLDLISCCNLMIYLDNVLQKKIINTFHYSLNNTGYLMMGKSENINNGVNLFTPFDKRFKIYARKKDASSRPSFDISYRLPEMKTTERIKNNVQVKQQMQSVGIEKAADAVLLENFIPASVVVNQDMEIIQFRGSTGLFLEHSTGKASFNLLKMARKGLDFELRSAILKVSKTGEIYKKSGVEVRNKNNEYLVNITILPLKGEMNERNFLVVFEETKLPIPSAGPLSSSNKRIKQLEAQLMAAHEDMRSIIEEQEAANEELQSANEEIVSSNEELQSTNEELETSKEEVESTNEELLTINQEIQLRNDQLAEEHEYSQLVFATIREAVIILDKDIRIKYANNAFSEIFGLAVKEAEGQLLFDLNNRAWDMPKLRKLLEVTLHHETYVHGFEISYNFSGNEEKKLLLNARKVVQKAQQRHLTLIAFEDITEHARATKIVEERESFLRNIANNAPVMIWVAAPDKQHNFFNRTWLEYTGATANTVNQIQDDWIKNIYKEDQERFSKIYTTSFDKRQPYSEQYRLKNRDGAYKWVLSVGKPMYDLNGVFTGYISSCTEVHDQKLANEELESRVKQRTKALEKANSELERSNSELEQFAYVSSHDLQEPLRKILLYSTRLQQDRDKLPKDMATFLGKINQGAERMTQLIDALLDFSKISRIEEKFEDVDLNNLIKEVLVNFEHTITEEKAKFNIGHLHAVNAVPVQMFQLFSNLIGNALKFKTSGKAPVVHIQAKPVDEESLKRFPNLNKKYQYIEIIVRDNGIGFAPAFADQIFVIFQRLNDKQNYPGTGIGLALCKKIVHFNKGTIFAESEENKGAAFHVILRVAKG